MNRIVSPGLPPWPKLMYDPRYRYAVVSARHPTWRSCQHANQVVNWICLVVKVLGIMFVVSRVAMTPNTIFVKVVITVGAIIVIPIAISLIRAAVPPFLARRLFASKTIVSFTPKKIVIRSRLYERPVVIWRNWNRLQVKCSFNVRQDTDAHEHTEAAQQKGHSTAHITNAMILDIVFHAINAQTAMSMDAQRNIMRAIPMSEIDYRLASRFTMVLTAALSLTADKNRTTLTSPNGTDIDSI